MSEMVEKVARAMASAESGPEGSALFSIHWDEFGAGYLDSARAAIEAIRVPTPSMVLAGAEEARFTDGYNSSVSVAEEYVEDAKRTYAAMIDAALKE